MVIREFVNNLNKYNVKENKYTHNQFTLKSIDIHIDTTETIE